MPSAINCRSPARRHILAAPYFTIRRTMLNIPDRRSSATAFPADADVTPIAALLADPARSAMLWALSDGRALPAGELAQVARIAAPSASGHLAKLVAGGLVTAERHGRHRYFRLVDSRLTAAMEALAAISPPAHTRDPKQAHAARAIRLARTCYDHLAGSIGVQIAQALVRTNALALSGSEYAVTPHTAERLSEIGIDLSAVQAHARLTRRPLVRACLDWSERRYHVAGALGAALAEYFLDQRWVERRHSSRALTITAAGRRALRARFDITIF